MSSLLSAGETVDESEGHEVEPESWSVCFVRVISRLPRYCEVVSLRDDREPSQTTRLLLVHLDEGEVSCCG